MDAPVQERRSEPGVTAARGGTKLYDRLQIGVAILNALENRRARTGDDIDAG